MSSGECRGKRAGKEMKRKITVLTLCAMHIVIEYRRNLAPVDPGLWTQVLGVIEDAISPPSNNALQRPGARDARSGRT